jgi:hypothetical protein
MLMDAKFLVNAGFRELAKKAHPDVGGTTERMHEINAANEWLLQRLAAQ